MNNISVACSVSTSYGRDSLPQAQRRIEFRPSRTPGVDLGLTLRSGPKRFSKAVDFFRLFFTVEVLATICLNTNKYAWMHIMKKPTYGEKDGSWREVMPLEMVKFIALLLYMGVLELPRLHMYWSTSPLLSGLLPSKIMSRRRFTSILAMIHVSDPWLNSATAPKLGKVLWLLDHINERSANFFQPHRNLSVDERMVKSKARSGIRQYMKDKIMKCE